MRHVLSPAGLSEPIVYAFVYACSFFMNWTKCLPQAKYQFERGATHGFSFWFVVFDTIGTAVSLVNAGLASGYDIRSRLLSSLVARLCRLVCMV